MAKHEASMSASFIVNVKKPHSKFMPTSLTAKDSSKWVKLVSLGRMRPRST